MKINIQFISKNDFLKKLKLQCRGGVIEIVMIHMTTNNKIRTKMNKVQTKMTTTQVPLVQPLLE